MESLKELKTWVEKEIKKAELWFRRSKSPYSSSTYYHIYNTPLIWTGNGFVMKKGTRKIAIVKVSDHYGVGGKNDKTYCIPNKEDPLCRALLPQHPEELSLWLLVRKEAVGE